MKRLWWLLIPLVVLALYFLGSAMQADTGYVLFAYKGFRYQSGLWSFLALLAGLGVLIWLLRVAIRTLLISFGVLNPWSRRNCSRRARIASQQGVLAMVEGRWNKALTHLSRAAKNDPHPLSYYLGAARAAHELARHEESDALLEQALNKEPQAELAVALVHAELQNTRGEEQGALETLRIMLDRYPGQPQVLRQLQQLYVRQQNWSALLGLLPELRKERVLPDTALSDLELDAWRGRLAAIGRGDDVSDSQALQELQQAWQQVPSDLRHRPELIAAYAERLCRLNAQEDAEKVLRKALKHIYDSRLARFYGVVRGKDCARQLQMAEELLKAHEHDPSLLLTLGRLCLQNQLWGKARDYIEASLRLERHPETCAELARLLLHSGELARSNQLLQESLGLLHQHLPTLPQPEVTKH